MQANIAPSSYRVRNIEIKNGLVLSPMSGVTTSAFRRLIKELNPGAVGLTVSEFVSVEALTRKIQRTISMTKFREVERPYGVQIFGYDIGRVRDAALMVQDMGADLVDLNCGCPAPKVVRKGGGCELMRNPDHLQSIVREVRKAVSIPFTMKIRSGWDENSKNALQIAMMAEGEGVEALAVHGRTRAQSYRGEADWSIAGEIARTIKIPVLGSGDVVDAASATVRLNHGVAGLYIGRAALFHPFVFSEIAGLDYPKLRHDRAAALSIIERYIELLLEDFVPNGVIGKVKQLVSQMGRGHEWRRPICVAKTLDEIKQILSVEREKLSMAPEVLSFPGLAPSGANTIGL